MNKPKTQYDLFVARSTVALVAASAAALACTVGPLSPVSGVSDGGADDVPPEPAPGPTRVQDAQAAPPSPAPPVPLPSAPADAGSSPVPSLVYLVSDSNEMYTFDPGAMKVADLGSFTCPGEATPPNPSTGAGAANSMALDASGNAWINFQDGHIFRVNTTSLNCVATSFQPGQAGFSLDLGMAFLGGSGSPQTLYVSDNPGPGGTSKGLASIDLATMTLHPVAAYSGVGAVLNDVELTGTPGGILYGLFSTSPSTLAAINLQSATTYDLTYLDAVSTGSGAPSCDPNAWVCMGNCANACDGLIGESCGWTAGNQGQGYHCVATSWGTACEPGGVTCPGAGAVPFAVASWGGNFWLFTASPTASDPNPTTSITEYDTTLDQTVVVMTDIGATIVGASGSGQK